MRDVITVPLRERVLMLQGRLTPSFSRKGRNPHFGEKMRRALPVEWPPTSRICFVSYAYSSLPLNKEFDTMFPVIAKEQVFDYDRQDCTSFRPHHLAGAIAVTSRILAVTQQFLTPESEIPDGWQTICLIDFPSGVPEMIEKLPEANGWETPNTWVCLCNYPTWSDLVATEPC